VCLPHGELGGRSFYDHQEVLDYFRAHAVAFYKDALPHLPAEHRFNGGLIFIGGVHLARIWGMATYTASSVEALIKKTAAFRQHDRLTAAFSWVVSNNASWQVQSGPQPSELEEAARIGVLPKSKCIAVISFSFSLNDSVWMSQFDQQYPQSKALAEAENHPPPAPSIWSSFSIAGGRSMTQGKYEKLLQMDGRIF
jgi:hypothetical protein